MNQRHEGSVESARLPISWPLYVLFAGYPVSWLLGLSQFIWPVVVLPIVATLIIQRHVRVPRGFGLWLGFLVCMLASAIMVDEGTRLLLFGYRASLYLSATVLFLIVYNAPRSVLPSMKIGGILAIFGAVIVVGGLLALAMPSTSFHTPVESIVPQGLLSNEWIHDLVHVTFTERNFLEGGTPRPSAPFSYTNGWGANFALVAPFMVAMALWGSRNKRLRWIGVLVASLIPLVISLNRGAWLALGLAILYATFRLIVSGRPAAVTLVVAASVITVAIVILTPLENVFLERLAHPHSNEGRITLYEESIDNALDSPLLGYGTTRPSGELYIPAQGTHGQIWLVLFSHGIPAALFFLAWFAQTLWHTRRLVTWVGFVANITVFIGFVTMWYYGLLASGLQVLMVAAAVAWREQLPIGDDPRSVATEVPLRTLAA